MRILISPAKKMNVDTDTLSPAGLPVFLEETEEILKWMRTLGFQEAKELWGCNEKIAKLNFERISAMELRRGLTPALLSYEGIQYQYMAPSVFEEGQYEYVQEHLRILSGFYGILKPMDGVTPYRLEMQAKAGPQGKKDLYDFWGDRPYREALDESRILINLASKEYAKCIEKYLGSQDVYLICVFGEYADGKVRQKGTYAKMARGEMVRFLAENRVESPQGLKDFDRLGYRFCGELSKEDTYVFIKQPSGQDETSFRA